VYWIGQDRVAFHLATGHRLEVSSVIQPEEGGAIGVREPKDHIFFVQTREQVPSRNSKANRTFSFEPPPDLWAQAPRRGLSILQKISSTLISVPLPWACSP